MALLEVWLLLVKADMIESVNFHATKIAVICVYGDTQEYPIATVKFETDLGTVTDLVGVVPHLVHSATIGRDFPKF